VDRPLLAASDDKGAMTMDRRREKLIVMVIWRQNMYQYFHCISSQFSDDFAWLTDLALKGTATQTLLCA